MKPKSRVNAATRLQTPDRVPFICQLSIGHYFLQSEQDIIDIWFTSEGFANALIEMAGRYHFDGILVNLPGRDPEYQKHVMKIEEYEDKHVVSWKNGNYTELPHADNPHYYLEDGSRFFPTFQQLEPEELFYIEPWDLSEITYPYTWGFEDSPRPEDDFFPEYHFDTLQMVLEKVGDTLAVHSEVFSPWSQFLELLNYENALMAILDDPKKCKDCLNRLTDGAIALAREQARLHVDAVLISSAFAGGGLISKQHYEEFVLPYERRLVQEFKKDFDIPIYTHTCGAIGDRLDLMLATETDGIDTLDPPPIGTVELQDAVDQLKGKVFIKGNVDPVNTLLQETPEAIREDARHRLRIAKPDGGYILSTACSVAPHTPPENIDALYQAVEEYGYY